MTHQPDPSNSLASVVASALASVAEHSFGLMGNGNAHLIDALTSAGVRYTAVRHEAATVASADAYTRVCGRIAIATTTYGAGFTNTLTALAESAQARIPMLVVVGDQPSVGPRPWDVDQPQLAAAVGVRTHVLSLEDPAGTVHAAAAEALIERRPVVIAIPYDLVTATVTGGGSAPSGRAGGGPAPSGSAARETRATGTTAATTATAAARATATTTGTTAAATAAEATATTTATAAATTATAAARADGLPGVPVNALPAIHAPVPSDDAIAAAVDAIARAQRPLLIAGRGAHLSGAGPALGRIADRLGALTASSALGRSVFPNQHFDLGVTGGFGEDRAMERIAEADVVVVIGASLNQFTMRFGELFGAGATVIRIDIDEVGAPKSTHDITHLLLRGDATAVLTRLEGAIADRGVAPTGWRETVHAEWHGELAAPRPDGSELADASGRLADGRLDPRAVAARLAEALPEQRHVTSDGGHFIGWASTYWPIASPERHLMVGTAYQTIGLGFSTVAGVAAALEHDDPESTIVVTTGDGGGLMAIADLETTIRTARRCVIVVWNDAAYGAEVHLYGRMGLDQQPMLIPGVDFAGVAEKLGATGVRVTTLADLDALTAWRDAGGTGTILLDCQVSRSVVAPYQREIQRVNGLDPDSPIPRSTATPLEGAEHPLDGAEAGALTEPPAGIEPATYSLRVNRSTD